MPYSASTSSLYCDEKLEVLDTLQRRSTVSSLSDSVSTTGGNAGSGSGSGADTDFRRIMSSGASSSIGGSSASKSSVESGASANSGGAVGETAMWRKLHGLMQEEGSGASAGVVTRRNSEGGVERVVDIGNAVNPAVTAYEKGGIFRESGGEEMGGSSGSLIESLVLQSAKDIFGVGDSLIIDF